MKSKRRILIGVFFAYLMIGYIMPLSGDDWTWGSSVGIKRLNTWFNNYSGRYAGNLVELIITRSHLIRTILYSFINTGIVFLSDKILNNKHKNILLIIILSSVSIPLSVYSQTYGWFAGFSNYNIAIFFTLINLNIIKNIFEKSRNFEAFKKKNFLL